MPTFRLMHRSMPFYTAAPWLLALPALLPLSALAQGMGEDSGTGAAPQLREVVVTSRRSLEDRFFSTGSLVVVDRQDIENMGVETVTDVLRQLPGVQVTPNANGSVDIRMRGMDASATRVLVDGQRSSGRSQLPFDQLPAELIERIEIVRAPSAEFSGASGGTINFVLRQGSAKRETNVRLSNNHVWGRNAGQMFLSRTGPVELGAPAVTTAADAKDAPQELTRPASWTYFMGVYGGGLNMGSDVERASQSAAQTTVTESSTRNRREEWTLLPRLNGRLSAKDQLAFRGTLTTSALDGRYTSQAIVGPLSTTDESSDQSKQYLQGAVDWTRRLEGSKLESSFSANRLAEDVTRTGQTVSASGTSNTLFQDQRQDSTWSLKTKLTGTQTSLLWMMGAELESRQATADTRRSVSGASPTREQLSADIQRHVLWGQNEWALPMQTTLTAGLRGESILLRATSADMPTSQRLNFFQPSLHTRTPLSDDLQWRANLARITRNPAIWDLVDRNVPSQGANSLSNPDQLGNPNLRPEVALTLDTGVEKRLSGQGQMGLNLFVRQLTDVMARRTTFDGTRWLDQRQNIGSATSWGLEADVKKPIEIAGVRGWNLSANGSLLQSRMNDGPDAGLRIPGQARYTGSVSVNKPMRRTGGAFGGVAVSLTGPASLSTANQSGSDHARVTLDVFGGSVIPNIGYWRLGVYNLGNARNRRDLYNTPGGVTESSTITWTPRVYMSVGTQF